MNARTLASFVVLGDVDSYPAGTCVAWLEAADRPCGKPGEYLCPRHVKVAQRRAEKLREASQVARESTIARWEEKRPAREAKLARIEAELDRIDPFRRDDTPDTAQVNVPLAKRLPSEARIERLANLHRQRASLRRLLGLPS